MIIEYKSYVISQTKDDRFDLNEKVKRNVIKKDATGKKVKSGETKEVLNSLAYDVRLETAINLIIFEELKKKERVVALHEFIEEFKNEKEEVLKEINY